MTRGRVERERDTRLGNKQKAEEKVENEAKLPSGNYIWKPATRKGPVFIAPFNPGSPPRVTLDDGRVVEGVRGDQAGGTFEGHEGYQWVFPEDVLNQRGAVLEYGGATQKLGSNSNMSYRGDTFGSLSESDKGAIGSPIAGPGEFGYEGSYAVPPQYIGHLFPDPSLLDVEGIKRAKYNFIDPVKFATEFGQFNRDELTKNYAQAKQFGLDAVDTELQGLLNFVPRSAQLMREQVDQDNLFNQAQRTRQIDSTIPEARADLNLVAENARAFASGRAPSSVDDRALELGLRSDAADIASASGFGASSSAARKASDLMSARERIELTKYGNEALIQNVQNKAELFLAPTSYSSAGQNIQIMPGASASGMAANYMSDINNRTTLGIDLAFGTQVDQSQYLTNLSQRTNEFNKTMEFNTKTFNASAINDFALSLFNYEDSYAKMVAAAGQLDLNTQSAINQQNRATDAYGNEKRRTKRDNTIRDVLDTVTGGLLGS